MTQILDLLMTFSSIAIIEFCDIDLLKLNDGFLIY